jgi:hypothetical protein
VRARGQDRELERLQEREITKKREIDNLIYIYIYRERERKKLLEKKERERFLG